jgi:hypothetical protein
MTAPAHNIEKWFVSQLENVKTSHRVLVRDGLHLLPEANGEIHRFARENKFTVIVAATNLAFRELYEKAVGDKSVGKLLILDRAPERRRKQHSTSKAPPPFYPDLLATIPEKAQLSIDLQSYLKEVTNDPNWPAQANDPQYAKLISRHIDGVLRAHRNLRTIHESRFTDVDLQQIVSFAAMGIPESAFKQLGPEDYWKIGLIGHSGLQDLKRLTPEIAEQIEKRLKTAEPPFCWLANHDTDLVLRAFYLSVVLSQHFNHWNLVLAKIDPSLATLESIPEHVLARAAEQLVELDPEQASNDMASVEDSLDKDRLKYLLFEQLELSQPSKFTAVVVKEEYSTLVRSLAMLLALDDLTSSSPDVESHKIINRHISEERLSSKNLVDRRPSQTWSHLKQAYELTTELIGLKEQLRLANRNLGVLKPSQLDVAYFTDHWNNKRLNRIEYFLSILERLLDSGEFLPRPERELPANFGTALVRIRDRVHELAVECQKGLDQFNARYQELIQLQYASWVRTDAPVVLTSQFLRRCLKPNWDPKNEKAVVLVFDGMRYDIWDELLRPMLEDRMELVSEFDAISILPSETHITRKALAAGTHTDEFNVLTSEDKLLKDGLKRSMNLDIDVEVINPESAGTGETVRYRAGNLDYFIFELCDKELHHIRMKTLPDGRQVAARPLAFVYQQHIKNIIDTEVMAIVRNLEPGTKVFVTADHGFGWVHRNRVSIEATLLNEPDDCSYHNAWLKETLANAHSPARVRENVLEYTVTDLRMHATESVIDVTTRNKWEKQFKSVIFPRVGYALARPGRQFNPDAYTHGGVSIQELTIPMAVLRVRNKDDGGVTLGEISGPSEILEGQEAEFRLRISKMDFGNPLFDSADFRVDVEATYAKSPNLDPARNQVLYVAAKGADAIYRFVPSANDATSDERKSGEMERTLTITVTFAYGSKRIRKTRTHKFRLKLNSEKINRRVPSHLGNILGLTPKSMR